MERPGDDRGGCGVFGGRREDGDPGSCGQWMGNLQGASGDDDDLGAPSATDQAPTAAPQYRNSSNNSNAGDEDDWDAPAKKPSVLPLEVCSAQSTESSNFNARETGNFYDCETPSSSRDDTERCDHASNSRTRRHSSRSKRALNTSPDKKDSDGLHEPLMKKKVFGSGSIPVGSQPSDSLEHLVTLSGGIEVTNTEEQPLSDFGSKGIFSQGGFLVAIHDERQEDTVNVAQGTGITKLDSDGSSHGTVSVSSVIRKSTRTNMMSTNTSRSSAAAVDSRPATEIAFSIDLIRKYIFTSLDVQTLKACRTVCKHWDTFASEQLKHRVIIRISFGHVVLNYPKFRSVSRLIGLMNTFNSGKLFPFTTFEISTKELSSPRIQELFDSVGTHMTKLYLSLDYVNQTKTFEQSSLIHNLSHLLIHQVPNLEFLEIRSSLPLNWWDAVRKWDAEPTAANPIFFLREIPGSENGNANIVHACRLPKLKAFRIAGPVMSKKIIEDILDAAINLCIYTGPSYPGEMLEYFIDGKGKDRIHLLKQLHVIMDVGGMGNVATLERLIAKHGQQNRLQLNSLYYFNMHPTVDTTAIWPRTAHILNQLFSSSTNTLKELVMNPLRFLEGLTIPRLPLKLLFFNDNSEDGSSENYFFPQGFSLRNTFPLVSSIGILSDFNSNSVRLLDILEPVPQVKRIHVASDCSISDSAVDALAIKFPRAYIKYD